MARKKSDEEEIKEPTAKEPEGDEEGAVEVDLSGPEDEDDEGDGEEVTQPRTPRAQRRANRFKESQERANAAEQEALRAKAERDQLAAMLQQANQNTHQQQTQQAAQSELDTIHREWEDIHVAFRAERDNGTLTPEKEEQYIRRAREIESKKIAAVVRQNGLGGQQITPQQVQMLAQRQMLMNRYGDVLQHPQAARYALGVLETRRARGEQDSEGLYDEIAEEARQRFGMQSQVRRPPPSAAQRQRFSGISAGGREAMARGNGNGGSMKLTKEDQKMATAMWPKLKPQEAFKRYAANLVQKRAARGEKIA